MTPRRIIMWHPRGRARVARLLAIPAAAALLGGLAVLGSGPAQASPRAGSDGWQSYLEQPATSNIRAVSATVLSGNVTNARGLTSAGHGDATLTVTAASDPATVLLDYGVEVEGTPYLDIASYNGTSPAVSLAFTETKTYLHTPDRARSRPRHPPGRRPSRCSREPPAVRSRSRQATR
jgi:hypothetical protein